MSRGTGVQKLWPAALGLVWIVAIAVLLQGPDNVAIGLMVMHVVGFGGLALTWIVARRTENSGVARVITWGWVVKVAGTLARYFVLEVVYGGAGDASHYGLIGGLLAPRIRRGDFSVYDPNRTLVGTQFVEVFTGAVFSITGQTVLGGFFVLSGIGFMGLYFIFRAVRIAAPEVDVDRYALFLFFLPTTLFWPSSLGKESLMVFCIGLVVYGAARTFTHVFGGVPIILAGIALASLVRPHIALMMGAALLGATTFVRSSAPRGPGEVPWGKVLRILVFVVAVGASLSAASTFLQVDQLDASSVSTTLQSTSARTSQGGSGFGAASPALYPVAVVTVLFRPFPFEAGNLQSAIASAESTLLLVLFVRRRRDVREAFRLVRTNGLFAFVLVYAGLFCFAYSSFGNFGLLARQRAQLYPLIVLFLCVPAPRRPASAVGAARRQQVDEFGLR